MTARTKAGFWKLSPLIILIGGCQATSIEIGREPKFTPLATTAVLAQDKQAMFPAITKVGTGSSGGVSTWSDRSADFFRDARAIRPGDILTVKISIKDKASFDNTANRSRDSKLESQGNFKLGLNAFGLSKSGDGAVDLGTGSKTSTEGRGAVSRSEMIDLLVAATVVQILPNGNLVIRGNQEIRVNFEMRVLNIEGIVRSRDIATDNSVSYEKIAEARVAYGGVGRTMEILQPPIGQQIMDRVLPF